MLLIWEVIKTGDFLTLLLIGTTWRVTDKGNSGDEVRDTINNGKER